MGYEKKTFRQIWKDVKCALGFHSLYTWNVELPYRRTQITECYNCRYKWIFPFYISGNPKLDEYLREIKKAEI
jgi:hypothetical protein